MSHIRRLVLSGTLLFADILAGILYVRMILPLSEYGGSGGQWSGPVSPAVDLMVYVIGGVLGVIALLAVLWPVIGAIREESARGTRRVPR